MTLLLHAAMIFAAVTSAVAAPVVAVPAYRHWQHGRCLARIEVLERELGIGVSLTLEEMRRDEDERVRQYRAAHPPPPPKPPRRQPRRGKGGGMWYGNR